MRQLLRARLGEWWSNGKLNTTEARKTRNYRGEIRSSILLMPWAEGEDVEIDAKTAGYVLQTHGGLLEASVHNQDRPDSLIRADPDPSDGGPLWLHRGTSPLTRPRACS
jgi:hypothetical protein